MLYPELAASKNLSFNFLHICVSANHTHNQSTDLTPKKTVTNKQRNIPVNTKQDYDYYLRKNN